ncbi:MAG: radical SAM protein [Candidatus Methanoperedens sp.]|nr:radical SAM protein [Candidatus Methanoperedens sp.]
MPSDKLFPALAPGYVLRKLESPFAYNISDDQLYELDDEAFEFLKKCDGRHPYSDLILDVDEGSQESIDYMIEERIIRMYKTPSPRKTGAKQSPVPSLRYLLLNITDRCNLACKHCYLGGQGTSEIKTALFEKAVSQFEEMGGLKLMISGGEPLLHPKFWELMEILPSFELRVILLSNGTLIGKKEASKLSGYVNEVQVSIDGVSGHDLLRGQGSFDKARRAICALRHFNIPVSVATMVHRYNMQEFEKMQELFSRYDILSWSVDVPCVTGNLKANPDYIPDAGDAAKFLKYGFGAGAHESSGDNTCGSHLCSVSPDGAVSKCGFFGDEPVGDVNDLKSAWAKLCKNYLWTLDKLECHDCLHIRECRGGCRFRAKQYKGILAPDPLMCHSLGVPMSIRE